jgi:hypothetical protein
MNPTSPPLVAPHIRPPRILRVRAVLLAVLTLALLATTRRRRRARIEERRLRRAGTAIARPRLPVNGLAALGGSLGLGIADMAKGAPRYIDWLLRVGGAATQGLLDYAQIDQ